MRVAVVQCGSTLFDTPDTVTRAVDWVRRAAADGAELVLLPEALIGGYPKGLSFGVSVGLRTPEGRDEFRRYWESAIDLPGPEAQTFSVLAAELGVTIVLGAIVRDGRTLYCCSLLFAAAGGPPAVHRKLVPTAAERLIWGSGDGSTLPVLRVGDVGVGSVICWENYMPLLRAAMYAKGVDIWCAPTVDDRDAWQPTMRHIAREGRCFVLSACQYLERSRLPDDVSPSNGNEPGDVLIAGGSVIVSPLGEVLAGPLHGGEGILTADLDLRDLARARMDFDVHGHYARPDVFQLVVDERPKPSVVTRD
jgi:nitrilase